MIRLLFLDSMATVGMGGPLAEQPDPASLHHVLDVGCGPGGWILETASRYPHMSLVGIDISWRMIEYATAQAQAQQLTEGVQFRVMDATKRLDFSDGSFDLVNMRFGSSFLLVQDWSRVLSELQRVTRPGGILRVTEGGVPRGNSPMYERLRQMIFCAYYRSGHYPGQRDMSNELERLLRECEYQQVQTRAYVADLAAGTVGGQQIHNILMYGYQTGKPFLQKTGCASEDYDALCEQALLEMQQPDFLATLEMLTTWGIKPDYPLSGETEDHT